MHPNGKAMILQAIRHSADFIYILHYLAEHSSLANDLPCIRTCILSLAGKESDSYAKECEFVAMLPLEELGGMLITFRSRRVVAHAEVIAFRRGVVYAKNYS